MSQHASGASETAHGGKAPLVLAIDQSTSGTKALLFGGNGELLGRCDRPHRQKISENGWVSHDPMEIWENTLLAVKDLLEHILDDTGYRAELNAEKTIESQTRLENLQELINKAADLHDEPEDAEALDRFLEEVALVAEVDSLDED